MTRCNDPLQTTHCIRGAMGSPATGTPTLRFLTRPIDPLHSKSKGCPARRGASLSHGKPQALLLALTPWRARARNGGASCRRPGGEMADAADSKSAGGDTMGVRPSPRAPNRACSNRPFRSNRGGYPIPHDKPQALLACETSASIKSAGYSIPPVIPPVGRTRVPVAPNNSNGGNDQARNLLFSDDVTP
jgi:hypothetical protein